MYSNILNAISGQKDYSKMNDNYRIFSELQSKGVSLSDILSEAERLKEQVADLEKKAAESVNTASFKMMEDAVKDCDDVKCARETLHSIKTRVLTELCMADAEYRGAFEAYRKAVNDAYTEEKTQNS